MDDKELDELLKNADYMYLSNGEQLNFGYFITGVKIRGKIVKCLLKNTSSFCEFVYDDYEYDGKEWITFYNKNGNMLDLKVK